MPLQGQCDVATKHKTVTSSTNQADDAHQSHQHRVMWSSTQEITKE